MDYISEQWLDSIKPILSGIVNSIVKAVGSDVQNYLINNQLDTNNALALLRGDFINSNLRDYVVSENDFLSLKHFKRCSWTGCLIIDYYHKITISITSRHNLSRIKSVTERKKPHYLQTTCHSLNSNYSANKQISLFDLGEDKKDDFSGDIYEADFYNIFDAAISLGEGYHHYVVVYDAEQFQVKNISMQLLDKDLELVQDISLDYLLQPDFKTLTDPVVDSSDSHNYSDVRSLIKPKFGLESIHSKEPDKKTIIKTKTIEGEQQA